MLQLSPEAMDLVGAGIDDRPGVRYQATVSMSPQPTPRRWAQTLGHPVRALSHSLFVGLLGHFRDDRHDVADELRHRDWLTSGSAFTHARFATLMDAVAAGKLA